MKVTKVETIVRKGTGSGARRPQVPVPLLKVRDATVGAPKTVCAKRTQHAKNARNQLDSQKLHAR